MSAVLTHAERDLADHLRDVDQAERMEAHKERFERDVHDDLRAQVLGALALNNTKAPIPNYRVGSAPPRISKYIERTALPDEVLEEAMGSSRVRKLLLDLLAEHSLAGHIARHAIATYYADLNAAGVAEARNWGLS